MLRSLEAFLFQMNRDNSGNSIDLPYGKKKRLHITGNSNSDVEKYKTQNMKFLPACFR